MIIENKLFLSAIIFFLVIIFLGLPFKKWGFKTEEDFFGMNFPDLPLGSEYCEKDELIRLAENRIKALEKSGIKHVFLLNHHGGRGQFATIDHSFYHSR